MNKPKTVYIISGRCYCNGNSKLEHYTDGLSIMLGSIIDNLSLDDLCIKVFLLRVILRNQYWRGNKTKLIVGNTFYKCLKYASIRELYSFYKNMKNDKKESLIKRYYLHLETKLIEDRIVEDAYVVNTHDLSDEIIEILEYCEKKSIPAIATLHIYIGKNENERLGRDSKLPDLERRLLENTKANISVVSTGMKKKIITDYPNIDKNRIFVILNGTEIEGNFCDNKKECIKKKKNVFLCVGTVGKHKNQEQLLKAIALLDCGTRNQMHLIFCGKDTTSGAFLELINKLQLTDCVEYLGEIKHSKMEDVYNSCDYTITTSLKEAFGLSIIEGFKYGKPSVFFEDFDAKDILYNEDCVCLIKGHQDIDIKNAINECITKIWDKKRIKEYSKKFDIKETAINYEKIYEKVGNKRG